MKFSLVSAPPVVVRSQFTFRGSALDGTGQTICRLCDTCNARGIDWRTFERRHVCPPLQIMRLVHRSQRGF